VSRLKKNEQAQIELWAGGDNQKQYDAWKAKNPQTVNTFNVMCINEILRQQALRPKVGSGVRVSPAEIWERMRRDPAIKRGNGEPYKLNNTMRPFLSHDFIKKYPHYTDYIELRKQPSIIS